MDHYHCLTYASHPGLDHLPCVFLQQRIGLAHTFWVLTSHDALDVFCSITHGIQSNLEICIWSVASKAIRISKYPLIEQPLTSNVEFCPSNSHPFIEIFVYRACLYRDLTVYEFDGLSEHASACHRSTAMTAMSLLVARRVSDGWV